VTIAVKREDIAIKPGYFNIECYWANATRLIIRTITSNLSWQFGQGGKSNEKIFRIESWLNNETRQAVLLHLRRPLITLFMLGAISLGFSSTHVNAAEEQKSMEMQIGEMRCQIDRAEILYWEDWREKTY
jgi:hypothetical protein